MSNSRPDYQNDEFIPLTQVAKKLGVRYQTAANWKRDGLLRTVRFGRRIYTTKQWLDDFTDACSGKYDGPPVKKSRHDDREQDPKDAARVLEALRMLGVRC